MPLNLPLPDWVPWWAQLVVLILAILFGFAFLMMPFAVFGLKGRLDFLEAQLDDIHAELRMIAMRLPDPDSAPASREPVFEQVSARPAQQREPSPTRVPAAAESTPAPERPLRDAAASRPSFREPPVSPPPPPILPRRPLRADDWTPAHPDDADDNAFARRPLRATTLRDPTRDRDRAEPTLHRPPSR